MPLPKVAQRRSGHNAQLALRRTAEVVHQQRDPLVRLQRKVVDDLRKQPRDNCIGRLQRAAFDTWLAVDS